MSPRENMREHEPEQLLARAAMTPQENMSPSRNEIQTTHKTPYMWSVAEEELVGARGRAFKEEDVGAEREKIIRRTDIQQGSRL